MVDEYKGVINATTKAEIADLNANGIFNMTAIVTAMGSSPSNTELLTNLGIKNAIDAAVAAVIQIQGDWNAATNTPDITTTTETGYAWRVSVAGSTDLGGITDWKIGDLAVKTAASWMKIDNEDIAAVWGNISGTLSDQTDLQNALNAKQDNLTNGADALTTQNVTYLSSVNQAMGTTDAVTHAGLGITGEYNLPTADGTADQILSTNGSGVVAFVALPTKKVTVPASKTATGAIGDWALDETTGYYYICYDTSKWSRSIHALDW